MKKPRVYAMIFANVYPLYIDKAEKKGRTQADVDQIIQWLTGNSQEGLKAQLDKQTDFETFFMESPQLNSARSLIKGLICGIWVEEIEEQLM